MKQKEQVKKRASIGGQAVMEGVMMQAETGIALAVRKADGSIMTQYEPHIPPSKTKKFYGLPIVRGVVNFVDMLKVGMRMMTISAEALGIEEEPSKFEKWLAKKTGKSADQVVIGFAIVLAVALAVGLFIVLPSFLATLVTKGAGNFWFSLVEGVIRLAVFIGYIWAISAMRDIKRVFMYHGAEHKVIATYEADQELTVENARDKTKLHPRCGTNYLFLVMMVAILFFSLLNVGPSIVARIAVRVVCLPIVAGLAYEVLKGAAKSDGWLARAVRWPGLQIQRMTTAEPDDSMLEVAITSFKLAENPEAFFAKQREDEEQERLRQEELAAQADSTSNEGKEPADEAEQAEAIS